ncbi:MAG: acetylglutamate kinase [Deltaproteobacteria bacterium]|nr:acetylglutamate kinase [Deltaproteobacteria bacterium]
MNKGMEKAKILIESLPYIKKFANKTVVIKYGGHAMADEELKQNFALDIILLKYIGINPVVVHGGGPQINKFLDKMNIKSNYIQGMRVTNGETMDVVEMVLVGKVNKEIVSLINLHGGKAVGLSGRDGDLIKAQKMNLTSTVKDAPPELIDLGRVGQVTAINPEVLVTLDRHDFIPVIAPVGVGEDGHSYNINADVVAGAIAVKLQAEKLILLTDVAGVLNNTGQLIPSMNSREVEENIASGLIGGGMIPKVKCCQDAVKSGVGKAHIIDGRLEHSLLLEIFTRQGIGTEIVDE